MGKNNAHPLDIHIGQRLRLRRKTMGMNQTALGKEVSVTFQQIQKYELGTNCISARRLHEFAGVLQVSPMYFYETYELGVPPPASPGLSAQAIHLAHNFERIGPKNVQKQICDLVRLLAGNGKLTEPVSNDTEAH
jgi:transcriptional regulator with XRE-family HTH domain